MFGHCRSCLGHWDLATTMIYMQLQRGAGAVRSSLESLLDRSSGSDLGRAVDRGLSWSRRGTDRRLVDESNSAELANPDSADQST